MLVDIVCDERRLVHMSDSVVDDVEHVLAQLLGVLWGIGLVDQLRLNRWHVALGGPDWASSWQGRRYSSEL